MYPDTDAGDPQEQSGALNFYGRNDMVEAELNFSSFCCVGISSFHCVGGASAQHRLDAKDRALRRGPNGLPRG